MFQPQSKGASYHKLWENLWGVNYTYFNIILLAKYAFSYKPLDYATPFHYPGKMDVNATCGFIAYRLELFCRSSERTCAHTTYSPVCTLTHGTGCHAGCRPWTKDGVAVVLLSSWLCTAWAKTGAEQVWVGGFVSWGNKIPLRSTLTASCSSCWPIL